MKRNKVLLGLYVGLLTLAGGVANAQTGNFYEIGPDNVGGEVSCLVVDRQDTSRNTLYAGAATGGLFLKSENTEILRQLYDNLSVGESRAEELSRLHDIWHRVPYYVGTGDSRYEVTLPVSCMTQAPNNELFIGTGSDDYAYGSTYGKMSRKGMGIYRYTPATGVFTVIPATVPSATDTNFNVVNALEGYYDGEAYYLYAATNGGLFRWVMFNDNGSWNIPAPTQIFPGRVDNIVISRPNKVAFFSSGNQVYRLGNVMTGTNPVNISGSNPAFGGNNIAVKLAVSQTDSIFLYAMVIAQTGFMDALYMTNNEQNWTTVTTSTIMPLTYNSGKNCGAIAVDPQNPRRVIIGGSNVLVGEGFVDGSYYQWTSVSANEKDLNYGDYMAQVYNNMMFIHSGIHQILPVYHIDGTDDYHTVYFATNGGVYSAKYYGRNGFDAVVNENLGMNNVQVNGLAVAPDGTVLMGANENACPIVEAHLAHFGGEATPSWYDNGTMGNFNHSANVLWTGNGGAVAASAFQQVYPLARRTIFVSSGEGNVGRSYADYLDYTNTTTWTIGQAFYSDQAKYGGPEIGSLYLWETDTNTVFKSYLKMGVDTLGYIFRKKNGVYDTVWVNDTAFGENRGSKFQMQKDDRAIFYSRGNADYPFVYQFKSSDINMAGGHKRTAKDSITVLNPIQSRLVFVSDYAPNSDMSGNISVYKSAVWYSWQSTDFTKVWDENEPDPENLHSVAPIFCIEREVGGATANFYVRQAVISNNGKVVYVSAYDAASHRSMLFRIRGFENVDFSKPADSIRINLTYNTVPMTTVDTLKFNGSVWFPRPISNIAVDPRGGRDRLVLTFEDYSNAMANVAVVEQASGDYSITEMALPDITMPAYSAIVEDSLGTIYVGTENGVYTRNALGVWKAYNNLSGVPVTAIVQQTKKQPSLHNLTHTGINANKFVFAKTKWPRAIYFGTYGRGVFMDMKYVTDTVNEVVDSTDFDDPAGIPTVQTIGLNSVKLFPNPVYDEAHVVLDAAAAGNGEIRIYDLNGRLVVRRNLGYVSEGEHNYTIDCNGMARGMYLINVIISGHTATTKMVVR